MLTRDLELLAEFAKETTLYGKAKAIRVLDCMDLERALKIALIDNAWLCNINTRCWLSRIHTGDYEYLVHVTTRTSSFNKWIYRTRRGGLSADTAESTKEGRT